MSASALDYVSVTITRDISATSRVGFGTLLFVGTTTGKQTPQVASYASFDEVAAVFADGDPEYEAALLYFGQENVPTNLYIGIKGGAETYVEAITAIRALNDDWYAVAIESRLDADILAVAAYIQTQDKLFLAATSDPDADDPTATDDIGTSLLDLNYDRTAIIYHTDADVSGEDTFVEAAWAGQVLPLDPGSVTWAWKTLTGVTADTLTKTQRDALTAKRYTYYTTVAGNDVTFEGAVSKANEFIDVTRGTDWIRFRLAEDIVDQLARSNKIPYIGGDAILEQLIRARLDDAVARNIIASGYTVTVPPAADQSVSDRAARIYNDITFVATLTGAVHKVTIAGTVSV